MRPIWATKSLDKRLTARVLQSCVFSGLIYGLHTIYFSAEWEHKLNAMQLRCLRRALGIQATYAAKLTGAVAVTNTEVAEVAEVVPLSVQVQRQRWKLLGHVLRRGGDDPMRAATYDRFGQPKCLAGTARWGRSRASWSEEVLTEVEEEMRRQGLLRGLGTGSGNINCAIAEAAQDRAAWAGWVGRWYNERDWTDF